jgi:hypothetical protein
MKKILLVYSIFALCLCSFMDNPSKRAPRTLRITLVSITCHSADDHGGDEELFGKLWVLNLTTYKTAKQARDAFKFDELLKVGDGSGSIWSTDRNNFITLRKGQSSSIGQSTDLTCEVGDKIIILGDLDERDYRDPDDYLEASGTVSEKIINTVNFLGIRIEKLVFKSGGTDVSMTIKVQKVN